MKVAVPTRGNGVDDHFGHCEAYTVFTIDVENKIERSEVLQSPQGCGCKSNIAAILKQMGVTVMLAGNMGGGAFNILNYHGIEVYRGCSGDIHKVVESFMKGKISDSNESCKSHDLHKGDESHQCKH